MQPCSRKPSPWDAHLPLPLLSAHVASSVVFIVAVTSFVVTHDADFVFDDSEALLNNKDVSAEDISISEIFRHDFWGNDIASNLSHKSYRPLTILTFRLNAFLASGLNPRSFHVTNIILHGIVSALFLPIFSILFSSATHNSRAAFLAALLFAVCPVHTESVAGVVGRADLMCSLCFLLSFYFYSVACSQGVSMYSRFSLHLLPSMMFAICSVLFKEQGITVLGLCSAYDVISVSRFDLLGFLRTLLIYSFQLPALRSSSSSSFLLRHLTLLLTGVFILSSRFIVMGSSVPEFQKVDNPHSFVESRFLRALNYTYLYCINAWLLILPHWLCFDWSMGCVPVINSITDPRNTATLVFLSGFTALVWRALSHPPRHHERCLQLSLAMLLIPFLPASNFFFRVGFVIAERVLYLPSAGFTMLLVIGLCWLCSRFNRTVLLFSPICVYALLLLNFGRSVQRSLEWRSERLLFDSGANVCPLNAKVHYNIGKIHSDHGNNDYAIAKYRQAIRLHPEYDQAMNNLANILKDQGELVEAESLLLRATAIRESFSAAWMNLGIVQAALKKTAAAERSYKTALLHRRRYPDCFYNLGNLYLETNQPNEALAAWRNATLLRPKHLSAWGNMILLLDNSGRMPELDIVVEEALKHLPDEPYIHYNYANALGKASRFELSEKHFLLAIQLNPLSASYHANLGVLYHRWGKLRNAETSYRKTLELDPQHKQTKEHLAMLMQKQKSTR
ncbi:hypothetical protein CAPTEDRAFT_123644 [Capitella teleta]|uniref:dolichyl-phosphate-mannose--protein mannosyltransferase n=2 Tax=Capitella teleta TaxID=283909 RepID=R7U5I3_CAPTE|nr:hypothetical protein CAPTEDRAFT_123644 [Capitella teleta]|eukprot:ELU01234.1 hypothetical protein CAPTEDRAFT_123644 [Capitella teleta]